MDTLTNWQRIKLVVKVIEVRLRFIAILVATALAIGYWDTIKNYWDKWTRPAAAATSEVDPEHEFYCPMHPQVVRPGLEPNGEVPKCPICGMPLSVRRKGEAAPLPVGVTGRVQLSPERISLAGVSTVEIGYRPLTVETTAVGNVTYDESRLSRVVSRVEGYVEKLYVDRTLVRVEKGQPLAEIYSPDLYSTAQELLSLKKAGVSPDLVASARKRLTLLGVSPQEIDALVQSGTASSRVVIRSPQSGYVMSKQVVAGSRVEPGMTLLDVADLAAVWIEADVFEKDLSAVRVGEPIEATVESLPERTFRGRVALVSPRLDTATRTARVRFEVDNRDHELRPGMYATVRINAPAGQTAPITMVSTHGDHQAMKPGMTLAVPERAVVDTGTRKVVYVERSPGVYEGVEVRLGPRSGEMYPVLSGLEAGQRVVAAGAFLVDAETRLNPAAGATYSGASGGPQTAKGSSPAVAPVKAEPAKVKSPAISPAALKNLAKLGAADEAAAKAQRLCPVTGLVLGAMGTPVKITVKGQAVFLCCAGCTDQAQRDPDATLKKVQELKSHRHD